MLARFGEELVFGCQQSIMTQAIQVLEHEVKTSVGAQTAHGRRQHHKNACVTNLGRQLLCGTVCKSTCALRLQGPLIPGLQAYKAACRALVTAQTRNLVKAHHIRLRSKVFTHLIQHFLQTGIGCASRQIHVHIHKALVFIGQEGRGQSTHQQPHGRQNHQKNQHHALGSAQRPGHSVLVAHGGRIKVVVEPAEEPVIDAQQTTAHHLLTTMIGRCFENGGAQCRRERQRYKH